MTPRIAIPLPTSHDVEYNRLNTSAYEEAVRRSGGEPVAIALDLPDAEVSRLAESCQGILLPGSPADVDPARYGHDRDDASAAADPDRERIDSLLLAAAFQSGKPALCICFGVQMLNVFTGGTLIQDLTVMPVNHAAGRSVAVAHTVSVAPFSLLGSLVDRAEALEVDGFLRLPINSSHHQAIGVPGVDLHISARCPQDAVIEAVERPSHAGVPDPAPFLLGVQWHPERSFDASATSRNLFARLIAEAHLWQEHTPAAQVAG